MKPAPVLTRTQLAEIARAALDNSASLLDDARVLLDAGRWPRAHALAVLAAEEFGKFFLCIVAGQTVESADAAAWKNFWQRFSSHRVKFAAWFGQYVDQQNWGPVGSEGDEGWGRAWDSRKDEAFKHDVAKQAGLYVGFDVTAGVTSIPAEVLGEKRAAELVGMVEPIVGLWMAIAPRDLTAMVTPDPRVTALLAEAAKLRAEAGETSSPIPSFDKLWKKVKDLDDSASNL